MEPEWARDRSCDKTRDGLGELNVYSSLSQCHPYYRSDTNGPRILLTPGILLLYIIPGFPSPIRSGPNRHRRLHVFRRRFLSRLTSTGVIIQV